MQWVAAFLLLAFVCGRLPLFGNNFSTVSAHSATPLVPAFLLNSSLARRSRRRQPQTPAETILAASYSRYSSDLQDESSIEQQQRRCREAADGNKHELLQTFEFSDSAVSGTKRERAGLNALLAAAKDAQFQVVYFDSLSRLARESVITMPMLKDLVYNYRVRIISVSEGIDSHNNNWDLMANFMSWVHEQYIKALRAAVLRGQEHAVLNDWSTGDWCFGYGSEPIPGTETGRHGRNPLPRMKVIINEEHARWVRQIFVWFVDEKKSIAWIGRELTHLGAPKDHRSSTPDWHPEYVRRTLRNEKFIGIWPWGQTTNVSNPLTGQLMQEGRPPEETAKWVRERPHLRLIEDPQFFRAQAVLDDNDDKCRPTEANGASLPVRQRGFSALDTFCKDYAMRL
ncbi:MAG: recombinase family protein [Gemmataceae bacterium]